MTVTLRGYASVFNRIVRTKEIAAYVVRPGGFRLDGASILLHLDHDTGRNFASTNNGSLRLWQDAHGLAFETDVDDDWLEDEVRSGRRREVSVGAKCWDDGEPGHFAAEPVLFFNAQRPTEISIVPVGGCPHTAVWASDTPDYQLTDRQREAARMWRMGNILERARVSAWSRPEPSPGASVSPHLQGANGGRGPAQPAPPGSMVGGWKQHGAAILVLARQVGFPIPALPIGMSASHLRARLQRMASER